jgi:hypothetical protein
MRNITILFIVLVVLLSVAFLQAQETPPVPVDSEYAGLIPSPLRGVWENSNRILSFYTMTNNGSNRVLSGVFLKMYYGWYYDRTAEPFGVTTVNTQGQSVPVVARDRNNVSAHEGEALITKFDETSPITETSGSWLMRVLYPPYRETDAIALAVIRNKLYLNFFIRYDENPDSRNSIRGFWRAAGTASGITASRPYYLDSIESLYITDDAVFRIRYWEVDLVPNLATRAYFSDGATEYAVDKYIIVGDKTFTCVQGRGTQIRQITQTALMTDYDLSDDGTLCAFSEPYLTKSRVTDVYAEIANANARKKPAAPPVFPPSDLDFHYDTIEDLRKYTPHWNGREY